MDARDLVRDGDRVAVVVIHAGDAQQNHGRRVISKILTDALDRTIGRRAQLPPETVLLLGEDETFSYEARRVIHRALFKDRRSRREWRLRLHKTRPLRTS